MMQNAAIQLLRPRTIPTSGEPLQRDHLESVLWQGRARLGKMTARLEGTTFGRAVVGAWECRFVAPPEVRREIAGGWRVKALLDGDSTWYEYFVQRVAGQEPGKPFILLDLERVG